MTDQAPPGAGPGTAGLGPDGAGFTYRGAEPELIVVARAEARLRADRDGVRSASGPTSPLWRCSSATNNSYWSRCSATRSGYGRGCRSRSRPTATAAERCRTCRSSTGCGAGEPGAGADRPDRGPAGDRDGLHQPGAVPAGTAPGSGGGQAAEGGRPGVPDFTGRQGYLRAAPEG
ncbi:hypothetical protein NKH77_10830 [Streptomyces sp. M19]